MLSLNFLKVEPKGNYINIKMCFVSSNIIFIFLCYSVRMKNQIRFLNINERKCLNPNDEKSPVSVEFYLVNNDGNYNSYMNEEFINLLEKHQFDYKLSVCTIKI